MYKFKYFYQCTMAFWGLSLGDPYGCNKSIYFNTNDIGPKRRFVNLFDKFSLLWGGRHVWKNDDNVSIVLHKQERASWLDFLGFSLLFIDIEITLIWVTFGFRLLLFSPFLEISIKSSEKVYVTDLPYYHTLRIMQYFY